MSFNSKIGSVNLREIKEAKIPATKIDTAPTEISKLFEIYTLS